MTESNPRSAASAAAEQVQAIVEAAAREEAARIRAEAELDSSRSREAAGRLGERADELERRLDELVAGMREALDGLRADLAGLRQAPEGEGPDELDDELIAEVEAVAAPAPDVREATPEPEGARVIALKMALDGAPREDTARYLSENFELAEPDSLLDEVYAKAGR